MQLTEASVPQQSSNRHPKPPVRTEEVEEEEEEVDLQEVQELRAQATILVKGIGRDVAGR